MADRLQQTRHDSADKEIKLLNNIYYTTNFWGLTKANSDKLSAVAKTKAAFALNRRVEIDGQK